MIFNSIPNNWNELQSYVGQMFRECGFDVEIEKTVELVRGEKEIDVYAHDITSQYKQTILIECKYWDRPVKQGVVHSFRTTVNDFGANVGFIVSKNGFQSGCYKASKNTNVCLVTLEELEERYYKRWKQNMIKKYKSIADELFPYWDPSGGYMPSDGGTIDREKQNLLYSAYRPICSISSDDFRENGFSRKYPINVPVVDDNLEKVDEIQISNDREYFDFIEENKDKAFKHFKILFRED